MKSKKLQIQQLDAKIAKFRSLKPLLIPNTGWIKAIRISLGMSMEQLGKKLLITKQSAQNIEKRERKGSITLKSLHQVAKALDMELVYGFIPNDGTIEALINKKAKELALKIVMRTSQTMNLEDQQNTKKRIKKAIEEKKEAIKNKIPKTLWD